MRFANSSAFRNRLRRGIDISEISGAAMDADAKERINGLQTTYQVAGAGLDSLGQIKSAANQARAIEAGGQAQAAAARASGISSMIGGVAGGIASLDFGGGGGGGSSGGGNFQLPDFKYY